MTIQHILLFVGIVAVIVLLWILIKSIRQRSQLQNKRIREPKLGISAREEALVTEQLKKASLLEELGFTEIQNVIADNPRQDEAKEENKSSTISEKTLQPQQQQPIQKQEQEIVKQEDVPNPAPSAHLRHDLIVLSVMATSDSYYTGYELLQALLSAGLRFGMMDIFHRYELPHGKGSILFSLASATEPGTFELNKMGGYACNGLTLFMRLSSVKEPISSFDLMLETAKQLIEDLGGEIWDEERKPITPAKIAALRIKASNYEQHKHTADLFE